MSGTVAAIYSGPGAHIVYEFDPETEECLGIWAATSPEDFEDTWHRFIAKITYL